MKNRLSRLAVVSALLSCDSAAQTDIGLASALARSPRVSTASPELASEFESPTEMTPRTGSVRVDDARWRDGVLTFHWDETLSPPSYDVFNANSFPSPAEVAAVALERSSRATSRENILKAMLDHHAGTVLEFREQDEPCDPGREVYTCVELVYDADHWNSTGDGKTLTSKGASSSTTMLHEWGHVAGLPHTHTRPNRTEMRVSIIPECGEVPKTDPFGTESAYRELIVPGEYGISRDAIFGMGSIMAYGSTKWNSFKPCFSRCTDSTCAATSKATSPWAYDDGPAALNWRSWSCGAEPGDVYIQPGGGQKYIPSDIIGCTPPPDATDEEADVFDYCEQCQAANQGENSVFVEAPGRPDDESVSILSFRGGTGSTPPLQARPWDTSALNRMMADPAPDGLILIDGKTGDAARFRVSEDGVEALPILPNIWGDEPPTTPIPPAPTKSTLVTGAFNGDIYTDLIRVRSASDVLVAETAGELVEQTIAGSLEYFPRIVTGYFEQGSDVELLADLAIDAGMNPLYGPPGGGYTSTGKNGESIKSVTNAAYLRRWYDATPDFFDHYADIVGLNGDWSGGRVYSIVRRETDREGNPVEEFLAFERIDCSFSLPSDLDGVVTYSPLPWEFTNSLLGWRMAESRVELFFYTRGDGACFVPAAGTAGPNGYISVPTGLKTVTRLIPLRTQATEVLEGLAFYDSENGGLEVFHAVRTALTGRDQFHFELAHALNMQAGLAALVRINYNGDEVDDLVEVEGGTFPELNFRPSWQFWLHDFSYNLNDSLPDGFGQTRGFRTRAARVPSSDRGRDSVVVNYDSDLSVQTGPEMTCGNWLLEGSEECDTVNLGGKSCSDFPPFTAGSLRCSAKCQWSTEDCV